MAKWKIRADQIGLALPKKKKVKRNKRASKPEKELQDVVNIKLAGQGVFQLRVPDSLFRTIFGERSRVPSHIQADISEHLAGWPDSLGLLPFTYRGKSFWLACPIELKTEIGKLTARQKERIREMGPYNILRTQQEFDELITIYQELYDDLEIRSPS